MAAGRNDPAQAFAFTAARMRAHDTVCVGVYPKDKEDMVAENARLLEASLEAVKTAARA